MRYLLSIFSLLPLLLTAQTEFKIAAGGKTVKFEEVHNLIIEGTSGNEMTFAVEGGKRGVDERAKGLRRISASGATDNTGVGLAVSQEDGGILVRQVGNNGPRVRVLVPNSAKVHYDQTTQYGGNLRIENFGGELDVNMMYNRVELVNVTGPGAINSIYGDVNASWDTSPSKAIRLHSTYSKVDATLPAGTSADLALSTSYGEMYTDFDIKLGANMDDARSSRKSGLKGTINGGGELISLSATYSNIYLRKK